MQGISNGTAAGVSAMDADPKVLKYKLAQATQLRDHAQGAERQQLDAAVRAYDAAFKAASAYSVVPSYERTIGEAVGAVAGVSTMLKLDPSAGLLDVLVASGVGTIVGDTAVGAVHDFTHIEDWGKLHEHLKPQLAAADETVAAAMSKR